MGKGKKNQSLLEQILAPVRQWLLEEGRCMTCGGELSRGEKKTVGGKEVISCSCGESYLYLPKANLYKRLSPNKYV